MNKFFFNQFTLLILAVGLLTFMSCSEDDGPTSGGSGDVSTTILGTWSTGTLAISEITINGESLSSFYSNLGLSDEEIALLETVFAGGSGQGENFIFTFEADGTYTVVDEDGTNSGTWEVNSSNTVITFDDGTESAFALDIVSISANKFVGSFTESDSSEDIDDDGSNDTLKISAEYILERN